MSTAATRSSLEALPERLAERRPASALVADTLRRAILRGAVAGGERLRQDAVAARLGVSQTIVREAFKLLIGDGFLTAEPRRGVRVVPLTATEAAEMTELRSLLEGQALAWAIPAMTGNDIAAAAAILDALDRASSTDDIIALNARFHATLYAPAKRERTLGLIETLRLNFERYLRFTWDETSHLDRSQQEHRDLLAYCRAGDTENACACLRRHITGTGGLLIERLRSRAASC
jgi:DNA-binding GntR family transcriptional regulator